MLLFVDLSVWGIFINVLVWLSCFCMHRFCSVIQYDYRFTFPAIFSWEPTTEMNIDSSDEPHVPPTQEPPLRTRLPSVLRSAGSQNRF